MNITKLAVVLNKLFGRPCEISSKNCNVADYLIDWCAKWVEDDRHCSMQDSDLSGAKCWVMLLRDLEKEPMCESYGDLAKEIAKALCRERIKYADNNQMYCSNCTEENIPCGSTLDIAKEILDIKDERRCESSDCR